MANYSRWEDIENRKGTPSVETRAGVEQDLDLGQLIYDLRVMSTLRLTARPGETREIPGQRPAELPGVPRCPPLFPAGP